MIFTFTRDGLVIVKDMNGVRKAYNAVVKPGWEEEWLKKHNITGYTIQNKHGYNWSTIGYYVKNEKEVLDALIELKKELNK